MAPGAAMRIKFIGDLFLKTLLIMLGAAVIDRLTAAEVKGAE
jgi:hypothetical protein